MVVCCDNLPELNLPPCSMALIPPRQSSPLSPRSYSSPRSCHSEPTPDNYQQTTDYEVDMRTIPGVVWRCVQVEYFCIFIVIM